MNAIWPSDPADDRTGTLTFERPAWRVAMELVAAPIGAVLFLGMAIALTGDAIGSHADASFPAAQMRYLAPAMFGLFGLIVAAGAIASIRRGTQRTVLEIGPHGIWTPEMGRLAWDEVAEIRCEWVAGATAADGWPGIGGVQAPTGRGGFLCLGIVPREGALAERGRRTVPWQLAEYATDVLNRLTRGVRFTRPSDLAPFCVADYEIGGRLDEAVAAIRAYHDVVDTSRDSFATSH